jgi:hypothetical protein
MTYKISQDAHKLLHTPVLKKKEKKREGIMVREIRKFLPFFTLRTLKK